MENCPSCGSGVHVNDVHYTCRTWVNQDHIPGRSFVCYERQIAALKAQVARIDADNLVLGNKAIDLVTEMVDLKAEIAALTAALAGAQETLNAWQLDAERYRFLRENHSYRYDASLNGPLETGISYHVQPLLAEDQGRILESFIDEEMKLKSLGEI